MVFHTKLLQVLFTFQKNLLFLCTSQPLTLLFISSQGVLAALLLTFLSHFGQFRYFHIEVFPERFIFYLPMIHWFQQLSLLGLIASQGSLKINFLLL